MVEKRKKTSGLLDRTPGNITPQKAFTETVQESESQKSKTIKPKNSFQYQKKNIKISGDQLDQLSAIKKIKNINFNYEAIQFLIDHYVNTSSPSEIQRFKRYTE